MNTSQPTSPRRRLQELLAIPDSERTDAQWDELNDLEIQLAPGNRLDGPAPGGGRNSGNPGNSQNAQARGAQSRASAHPRANPQGRANARPPQDGENAGGAGGAPGQAKKPFRKFHKRPAKPNPQGGA